MNSGGRLRPNSTKAPRRIFGLLGKPSGIFQVPFQMRVLEARMLPLSVISPVLALDPARNTSTASAGIQAPLRMVCLPSPRKMPAPVDVLVLLIETLAYGIERRAAVGHTFQLRAFQIFRLLRVPVRFRDQIVIKGAVLLRMWQVQRTGLDGLGNLDVQQYLVERDAKFPAPIGEGGALGGGEELYGRMFVRDADIAPLPQVRPVYCNWARTRPAGRFRPLGAAASRIEPPVARGGPGPRGAWRHFARMHRTAVPAARVSHRWG